MLALDIPVENATNLAEMADYEDREKKRQKLKLNKVGTPTPTYRMPRHHATSSCHVTGPSHTSPFLPSFLPFTLLTLTASLH